jgi:hypothetical protein
MATGAPGVTGATGERWVRLGRGARATSRLRVLALAAVVAAAGTSCDSPPGSSPDSGAGGGGGAQADSGTDAPVEKPPTGPMSDAAVETTVSGSDAADAAAEAPAGDSDAADGPVAPRIVSVVPAAVFRGDEVSVMGSDFSPMPRANLGGVVLDPIRTGPTELRFRVPSDFQLRSCEDEVPLTIETDVGASVPATVVIRDPGPSLAAAEATIRAGATMTLGGCNLTTAQATLNRRALAIQAASSTMLAITVPRDTPAGSAALVITNEHGRAEFQITVLPPTPQVLATDLPAVGSGGVVFVTTDAASKTLIDSVRVGDVTIPVSDATSFKWTEPGSTAPTSRMAIRIPATGVLGSVNISLSGSAGVSAPFPIMVITPPAFSPPAAGTVVITPAAASPDGTFPFGTQAAFRVADPGITPLESPWSYVISFAEPSGQTVCTGMGSVTGTERHSRPPNTNTGPVPCTATNHDACHPVTGTYVINGTGNRVMLTIDRTSTGGTAEQYAGGWVAADGTSLPGPGINGSSYLVIRSLSTGIQVSIRHGLKIGCQFDL